GDLARLDDVERHAAPAGLEDELSVAERADRGQCGQAFDFGVGQLREREVMSVVRGRHHLGLRGASRAHNHCGAGREIAILPAPWVARQPVSVDDTEASKTPTLCPQTIWRLNEPDEGRANLPKRNNLIDTSRVHGGYRHTLSIKSIRPSAPRNR